MPQFDFFSFFVQTFWLTIIGFAFYLILLKFPLNHTSQVLKMRNKLKDFAAKTSSKSKNSFIYNAVFSFFL